MSNLPTGVVTFLFTDIEGSTRLWEQYPNDMPAALGRHDDIMRDVIAEHEGVIFRTVGDAFFAAFAAALPGLLAALAAQRALHTEPWGPIGAMRVRMALHSSAVDLRDDGYVGPPLNRVARLLSAGHGGQTLICQVTKELVQAQIPAGVELRDLGDHQLRDLNQPLRIFQLVADGLPADFPPIKTLTNQALAADAASVETPLEAHISRQHKLPGMPEVDFDAILKKERELQRKKRKGRREPPETLF
ncbi:MAG TPA: adenylate/guanylate cyclase domain-containing protein [Roseiflexaceae bacterium]|nr:adenylate/guanylate cyclase domain-containing protein [Roseiflexaceae bacterium]